MPSSEVRPKLLQAAQSFTDAFASQRPADEIFSHFSPTSDIRVFEHGLAESAPFLGREFTGQAGLRKYFQTISEALEYKQMAFENFLVDPDTCQVSCKGRARFTWSSTGQSWDETFTYTLGFDDNFKVRSYEIWADTGAAYLASKGQLEF